MPLHWVSSEQYLTGRSIDRAICYLCMLWSQLNVTCIYCEIYCIFAGPLTAVAEFDQGGVVGTIVFTLLENGSTEINSSFSSGEFSGWHVHLYPVDYTDDPATRCGPQGTGPHYDPTGRLAAAGDNYSTVCNMDNPLMCEAGDFHGKFGPLEIGEFSFIDSDPILQLMGQYGIIGRSVVIHAPDATASRIACANIILQDDTPQIFVATFLGPVAGSIYFRQSATKPEVDTFIYAKLFYTDGRLNDTEGHLWGIYNNELVRLHLFAILISAVICPCMWVYIIDMNYRCVCTN